MREFVGFLAGICRVPCREIEATRQRFSLWNQTVELCLSGLSGFIGRREPRRIQGLKIAISQRRAARPWSLSLPVSAEIHLNDAGH
jgi:hypothetical protein